MCKVSAINTQALLAGLRDRTCMQAQLVGRDGARFQLGIPQPAPQELTYPLRPGVPQRFVFQRYERKGLAIYSEVGNG